MSGGESQKQRGRSESFARYEQIRQQEQQQLFTMWGSRRIQIKISDPADMYISSLEIVFWGARYPSPALYIPIPSTVDL